MQPRGRIRRTLARTVSRTGFVAAGVPLGIPGGLVITALGAAPGAWSDLYWIVVALAALTSVLTLLQRERFRTLLGVTIPATRRSEKRDLRALLVWLRSDTTWRQFGYHLVAAPLFGLVGITVILLWPAAFAALLAPAWTWALPGTLPPPVWFGCVGGLLVLAALPWTTAGAVRVEEWVARLLLGPNRAEELARRVETLAESRAGVVDAADTERRRIERDLHDGAQQRLVSLAVNLGLALATMKDLPPDARKVIAEAHREAKDAIEELALLVRGLHPAVLDDRGLDAALSGIAERASVPVDLSVHLPERPAPTVEAVAYFVVSEALANIAKHAHATRASIDVRRRGDLLRVTVTDDGVGAADPAEGTGLRGLAHRAASVDGTFHLKSPGGGPTVLTVELPCVL